MLHTVSIIVSLHTRFASLYLTLHSIAINCTPIFKKLRTNNSFSHLRRDICRLKGDSHQTIITKYSRCKWYVRGKNKLRSCCRSITQSTVQYKTSNVRRFVKLRGWYMDLALYIYIWGCVSFRTTAEAARNQSDRQALLYYLFMDEIYW